jgi:hypothetical protein
MKLVRPYIPLGVRLEVIARQLQLRGQLYDVMWVEIIPNRSTRLAYMLSRMFGAQKVHLDHDPPLCLRYFDPETGLYEPDANDPNHLVYRTEEEHRVKTYMRGDGAQLSDAGKRRKEIRRRRKETPRPSRWPPKGSRPMQWKPR